LFNSTIEADAGIKVEEAKAKLEENMKIEGF
jgi:hypothetical protein